MENKSNAFLAGVFTIGLAVLVLFSLFWFSSDHAVRVPYDLITRSTVNGLGPQADVKYRGLDVGKVVSIKFDPQVPGQIIVRINAHHLRHAGLPGRHRHRLRAAGRYCARAGIGRQFAAPDDIGARAGAHRDAARVF
jgi:hypothetical protein